MGSDEKKRSSILDSDLSQPAQNLRRLLAAEDTLKRNFARNTSSRHSRFGTTISVTLNPKHAAKQKALEGNDVVPEQGEQTSSSKAFVLHRQQALHREAGTMLDKTAGKRARAQKIKKVDELGREENLSLESKMILQGLAKTFIVNCFNRACSACFALLRLTRHS